MPERYIHLKGNEARDQILKHKGIIKPDESAQKNILAPKICPLAECKTSNVFDALKCSACGYFFSFEERKRVKEEEEQEAKKNRDEVQALKDQLSALAKQVSALSEKNQNNVDDYIWEQGWVKGGKAQPILIKDEITGKVNRLGVEALLNVAEDVEEDKKISEEDRRELEYMQAHSI
jgi:hypothetical protein